MKQTRFIEMEIGFLDLPTSYSYLRQVKRKIYICGLDPVDVIKEMNTGKNEKLSKEDLEQKLLELFQIK